MTIPLLSIVVPTSGKERNLTRCLDSLIFNAPRELICNAELVIFLNEDPIAKIQNEKIDAYIEGIRSLFGSLKAIRSSKFELTAEESAYAATAHATGRFIWLVGDKRIFFPEGMRLLNQWLANPTAPAAYFNSSWIDQDGLSHCNSSTHFAQSRALLPYKLFVMGIGINYMATNMGTWVFERQAYDMEVWHHLIEKCGPHFSHVALAIATMGDANVQCFSTYLCQLESKAYHAGDDSEWVRYAKLSKTYRFYAWTLGMVRQFEYLVHKGAMSYADIRRSMCSQGGHLGRQIDEIYVHLLGQLRYGWYENTERITSSEFDEMYQFVRRVCPERVVFNEMLRDLYAGYDVLPDKVYSAKINTAYAAVGMDFRATRLGSLIVGQVSDRFIRLHPKGYVLSRVHDNERFLLAYKLADAPLSTADWSILSQEKLDSLEVAPYHQALSTRLFNIYAVADEPTRRRFSFRLGKVTGAWVVRFYRRRSTYRLVKMLPTGLKKRLRALLT